MTTVTIKKEDRKTLDLQDECAEIQYGSNEDSVFNSLSSIDREEKNLIMQKENLKALLQQLESKAEEEIEKRRRRVESLNSEVSELMSKCKKFANLVNSDSALGRSKADS
jgi:DNA repair exonuclease SbcCD ATPase subunit